MEQIIANFRPIEIQKPYQCAALAASFISSPYSTPMITADEIYSRRKNKRQPGMPLPEALDILMSEYCIKGYYTITTLADLVKEVLEHPCVITLPMYDRNRYQFWRSPIHDSLPLQEVPYTIKHAAVIIHTTATHFLLRNSYKNADEDPEDPLSGHVLFPHSHYRSALEANGVIYYDH